MRTKNLFERIEKNAACLVFDLSSISELVSKHFECQISFTWVIGDGVCIDIEDGLGGLKKISASQLKECLKQIDKVYGLTLLRSL